MTDEYQVTPVTLKIRTIMSGVTPKGEDVEIAIYTNGDFKVTIDGQQWDAKKTIPMVSPAKQEWIVPVEEQLAEAAQSAYEAPPKFTQVDVSLDELREVFSNGMAAHARRSVELVADLLGKKDAEEKLAQVTDYIQSLIRETCEDELNRRSKMTIRQCISDCYDPDTPVNFLGTTQHNGSNILIRGTCQVVKVYLEGACQLVCDIIPVTDENGSGDAVARIWHENPAQAIVGSDSTTVGFKLADNNGLILTDPTTGAELHLQCRDTYEWFDPTQSVKDI